MRCMNCLLIYIGQTGRTFQTRYKENIQAIRNNNGNSRYSNHILNIGNAYGIVTNAMKVIKIERIGKHLKTLEKPCRWITNERHIHRHHNPILEVIQELNNRERHKHFIEERTSPSQKTLENKTRSTTNNRREHSSPTQVSTQISNYTTHKHFA
jgi:hypothetical protein